MTTPHGGWQDATLKSTSLIWNRLPTHTHRDRWTSVAAHAQDGSEHLLSPFEACLHRIPTSKTPRIPGTSEKWKKYKPRVTSGFSRLKYSTTISSRSSFNGLGWGAAEADADADAEEEDGEEEEEVDDEVDADEDTETETEEDEAKEEGTSEGEEGVDKEEEEEDDKAEREEEEDGARAGEIFALLANER